MKQIFCIFCFTLLILPSCGEADQQPEKKGGSTNKTVPNKNIKPGFYQEFYDNGQVKIEGKKNKDGLKHGIWVSFFENGEKMSESNFKNGVNDGYSMVWQPNGLVHYFGSYRAGKKVGEWTFYDKEGKVKNVENY